MVKRLTFIGFVVVFMTVFAFNPATAVETAQQDTLPFIRVGGNPAMKGGLPADWCEKHHCRFDTLEEHTQGWVWDADFNAYDTLWLPAGTVVAVTKMPYGSDTVEVMIAVKECGNPTCGFLLPSEKEVIEDIISFSSFGEPTPPPTEKPIGKIYVATALKTSEKVYDHVFWGIYVKLFPPWTEHFAILAELSTAQVRDLGYLGDKKFRSEGMRYVTGIAYIDSTEKFGLNVHARFGKEYRSGGWTEDEIYQGDVWLRFHRLRSEVICSYRSDKIWLRERTDWMFIKRPFWRLAVGGEYIRSYWKDFSYGDEWFYVTHGGIYTVLELFCQSSHKMEIRGGVGGRNEAERYPYVFAEWGLRVK